jgi:hypothetical protein
MGCWHSNPGIQIADERTSAEWRVAGPAPALHRQSNLPAFVESALKLLPDANLRWLSPHKLLFNVNK